MPLLIGEHFDKLPDQVVPDISRQRHEDLNMVLYWVNMVQKVLTHKNSY